ncbi:MAG: type II toxin-antitoxin system VapC family toxin [Ottowia sp.]|nr:type II toxin-antitoxin system VapC family toxin [Ottowia sp.]
MKPYMLDTNICSFIIREEPQQVLHNFERAAQEGRAITISAITYIELLYGAISPRAPKKVLQGVRDFVACLDEISPLDAAAIAKGAEIQRELLKKGTPIGQNDSFIAAHAITSGSILITNNMREFARVPGLDVQDWVQPH